LEFYKEKNQRLDIIWNLTSICPWNCSICCVDAKQVSYSKITNLITIRDSVSSFEVPRIGEENIFNASLKYLQSKKLELTYEEKIKTLDNIDYDNVQIDFSGGDALIVEENHKVLEYAAHKIGKENITITLTGNALNQVSPGKLKNLVKELNFTYDFPENDEHIRSAGYNFSNLSNAQKFAEIGMNLRAEVPLSTKHKNLNMLNRIYLDLKNIGVKKLLFNENIFVW